ncbi:hypothetical protein P872_11980 [Rhodonellum psychrophilum GCM71 = DSM 17998]|uniref:Uncharacterized protein n=1 Tax=Rhodonellum psychrophilum GCM71 = DSM 17998 TaxID=1123057 RepID=U5BTZ1_9BACT|nr:hypothetical protein P872_11980 [Rhodonellum psychrophilum GCM71 = DSM 17998]
MRVWGKKYEVKAKIVTFQNRIKVYLALIPIEVPVKIK